MPQCQLLTSILPENETCSSTYQRLQAQNQWWLSYLQAAHRTLLLPCKTLPREQVSCAILPQYQAETATTTAPAQATAGPDGA